MQAIRQPRALPLSWGRRRKQKTRRTLVRRALAVAEPPLVPLNTCCDRFFYEITIRVGCLLL